MAEMRKWIRSSCGAHAAALFGDISQVGSWGIHRCAPRSRVGIHIQPDIKGVKFEIKDADGDRKRVFAYLEHHQLCCDTTGKSE